MVASVVVPLVSLSEAFAGYVLHTGPLPTGALSAARLS